MKLIISLSALGGLVAKISVHNFTRSTNRADPLLARLTNRDEELLDTYIRYVYTVSVGTKKTASFRVSPSVLGW